MRTEVIKKVLYLEVTYLGPFEVLFSSTHTLIATAFPLLETVLVHFFYGGFQLLRRVCLNLRNRFKSFSFEGFFRSWEQKSQVSRWGGEEQ